MGKWPGPILSYYLGQASANALLATAAGATDPAAKTQWTCEANFYIGREKIESNDTAEALPSSPSAAASCPM
jgi:lipoprotein NlpI